jgi:hypothetical protein
VKVSRRFQVTPTGKYPTDKCRLYLDRWQIVWIICLTYCDVYLNCWTKILRSHQDSLYMDIDRGEQCCLHRLAMTQRSMTHAQAFRNFVKIVNGDGVRSACRNETPSGCLLVRHRGGVWARSPEASPCCLVLTPHFSLVCRSC